eukprot:50385-Pyramimonas_sp.AAC.1
MQRLAVPEAGVAGGLKSPVLKSVCRAAPVTHGNGCCAAGSKTSRGRPERPRTKATPLLPRPLRATPLLRAYLHTAPLCRFGCP